MYGIREKPTKCAALPLIDKAQRWNCPRDIR